MGALEDMLRRVITTGDVNAGARSGSGVGKGGKARRGGKPKKASTDEVRGRYASMSAEAIREEMVRPDALKELQELDRKSLGNIRDRLAAQNKLWADQFDSLVGTGKPSPDFSPKRDAARSSLDSGPEGPDLEDLSVESGPIETGESRINANVDRRAKKMDDATEAGDDRQRRLKKRGVQDATVAAARPLNSDDKGARSLRGRPSKEAAAGEVGTAMRGVDGGKSELHPETKYLAEGEGAAEAKESARKVAEVRATREQEKADDIAGLGEPDDPPPERTVKRKVVRLKKYDQPQPPETRSREERAGDAPIGAPSSSPTLARAVTRWLKDVGSFESPVSFKYMNSAGKEVSVAKGEMLNTEAKRRAFVQTDTGKKYMRGMTSSLYTKKSRYTPNELGKAKKAYNSKDFALRAEQTPHAELRRHDAVAAAGYDAGAPAQPEGLDPQEMSEAGIQMGTAGTPLGTSLTQDPLKRFGVATKSLENAYPDSHLDILNDISRSTSDEEAYERAFKAAEAAIESDAPGEVKTATSRIEQITGMADALVIGLGRKRPKIPTKYIRRAEDAAHAADIASGAVRVQRKPAARPAEAPAPLDFKPLGPEQYGPSRYELENDLHGGPTFPRTEVAEKTTPLGRPDPEGVKRYTADDLIADYEAGRLTSESDIANAREILAARKETGEFWSRISSGNKPSEGGGTSAAPARKPAPVAQEGPVNRPDELGEQVDEEPAVLEDPFTGSADEPALRRRNGRLVKPKAKAGEAPVTASTTTPGTKSASEAGIETATASDVTVAPKRLSAAEKRAAEVRSGWSADEAGRRNVGQQDGFDKLVEDINTPADIEPTDAELAAIEASQAPKPRRAADVTPVVENDVTVAPTRKPRPAAGIDAATGGVKGAKPGAYDVPLPPAPRRGRTPAGIDATTGGVKGAKPGDYDVPPPSEIDEALAAMERERQAAREIPEDVEVEEPDNIAENLAAIERERLANDPYGPTRETVEGWNSTWPRLGIPHPNAPRYTPPRSFFPDGYKPYNPPPPEEFGPTRDTVEGWTSTWPRLGIPHPNAPKYTPPPSFMPQGWRPQTVEDFTTGAHTPLPQGFGQSTPLPQGLGQSTPLPQGFGQSSPLFNPDGGVRGAQPGDYDPPVPPSWAGDQGTGPRVDISKEAAVLGTVAGGVITYSLFDDLVNGGAKNSESAQVEKAVNYASGDAEPGAGGPPAPPPPQVPDTAASEARLRAAIDRARASMQQRREDNTGSFGFPAYGRQ